MVFSGYSDTWLQGIYFLKIYMILFDGFRNSVILK